jgi:hypothetical protein
MTSTMHQRNVHLHPCFTRMMATRTFVPANFDRNLWRCIMFLHRSSASTIKRTYPSLVITMGNCSILVECDEYVRNRIRLMAFDVPPAVPELPTDDNHETFDPVSLHIDFSERCQTFVSNPDLFRYMSTEFWDAVYKYQLQSSTINTRFTFTCQSTSRSPSNLVGIELW